MHPANREGLGLDALVVPGLLLLTARDLLLFDPPRVLAWRLLHAEAGTATPGWLLSILPRSSVDVDPLAVAVAACSAFLALAYLVACLCGAGGRLRALLLAVGGALVVVVPTAAFVAMGFQSGRPYGQDGGVVQLPLAIDLILSGQSPYGADYTQTLLGTIARASAFWDPFGGNPILHHHAYLPGTHVLFLPFAVASRALLGGFDPRFVTVLAWLAAAFLAVRLVDGTSFRLAAAACVLVNPLVYWHQIFGANEMVFIALLLGAVLAARSGRSHWAAVLLGVACATKQLAWPFAPFLLVHLAGVRSLRQLATAEPWRRVWRPALLLVTTVLLIVGPVAALDLRRFWGDIFVYNVGLPGGDNYPLGGTPGFGFANLLIYFGVVGNLKDYFPFGLFYLVLVPIGLVLLRTQMRSGRVEAVLWTGSVALLASVYFSRVAHPNYLVPVAVLLPVALLALRRSADAALVPLLLLAVAVEVVQNGVFRLTWDQAVASQWPRIVNGGGRWLLPRCGPLLTDDPIGLLVSAIAAGAALAYAVVGATSVRSWVRSTLVVMAGLTVVGLPAHVVADIGVRTGVLRSVVRWPVQAAADARRLVTGDAGSPAAATGREAWSTSFRLDPPAALEPGKPLLPGGVAVLAAVGREVDVLDPRGLVVVALFALAAMLALRLSGEMAPALLGLVLLAPPLATGTTFGSPGGLAVACLGGALLLWSASRPARGAEAVGCLLLGVAVASASWALPSACAVVLALRRERRFWAGALAVVSALVLVLPAWLRSPGVYVDSIAAGGGAEPGVGISLGLLGGALAPAVTQVLRWSPVILTLCLIGRAVWGGKIESIHVGAWALAALILSPAPAPDLVAVPMCLLALGWVLDGARGREA